MPRLSIIVPAVDSIASLESTLVSLLQNRPYDSEILVVLNQSYNDPYALAGEVEFLAAPAAADAATCANLGIQAARANVVHILASGCEVKEGWSDPVVRHFARRDVAAVAPQLFDRLDQQRLLARGVSYGIGGSRRVVIGKSLEQASALVLAPAGCAAFYRREAILALGGIDSQLGCFADIELGIMFRAVGARTLIEPLSIVFAPQDLVTPAASFQNGVAAERLFWRSAAEYGWAQSLLCHAGILMAELGRCVRQPKRLSQIGGRAVGAFHLSSHAAQRKRLQQLHEVALASKDDPSPQLLRVDAPHVTQIHTERRETRKAG